MHDNHTARTGSKGTFFPKHLKSIFECERSEHFSPLYAASCTSSERHAPCPMPYALCPLPASAASTLNFSTYKPLNPNQITV